MSSNVDVESVKKWISELVKIDGYNIYYHPENIDRPYYKVKVGKFYNHKRYYVKTLNEQKYITYQKKNEITLFEVGTYKII
jgi:hypothetical protein